MIVAVGELTPAQKQSLDEFVSLKESKFSAKREARLKILNDMFDETSSKLMSTQKLLEQKYNELEKITGDLTNVETKLNS
jgi:hypothetical protein